MKVPALRLNRDALIVPIHADVTDEDVSMFQSDLTEGLARNEARGVVIDVSALDIADSFMARVSQRYGSHAGTDGGPGRNLRRPAAGGADAGGDGPEPLPDGDSVYFGTGVGAVERVDGSGRVAGYAGLRTWRGTSASKPRQM